MTTITITNDVPITDTVIQLGTVKVQAFNGDTHFRAHFYNHRDAVTLININNTVQVVNSGRGRTAHEAVNTLLNGVAGILSCKASHLKELLNGGIVTESIVDVKAYLSRSNSLTD